MVSDITLYFKIYLFIYFILSDHGQNENGNPSPITGLVSTVESKQSSGSIDGVGCSGEWILLQNKATFGVASSVESVVTDEKGSNKKKTGLNKKPRQQTKPKKKKLRPKVVVDDDKKKKKKKIPKTKSKLPKVTTKTPKPSTPKPVISKKRRKGKNIPPNSEDDVEGPPLKSCKKGLNFELEIYAQSNDNVNAITHQYELRPTNRLRKWRFDDYLALEFQHDHGYENKVIVGENGVTEKMSMVNDGIRNLKIGVDKEGEVCSAFKSMEVYQRRRRKDQCISKNMFPGFPKLCKKKRSLRRRKEAVPAACQIASPLPVMKRKKRSNRCTPRQNLASLIAMPICEELPWKLGERQKKGIPSKPKTNRPATTPSKRKGQKKKRPLKIEGKPGNTNGNYFSNVDNNRN